MTTNLERRVAVLEKANSVQGTIDDLLLAYAAGKPLPEPSPKVRRVLEQVLEEYRAYQARKSQISD